MNKPGLPRLDGQRTLAAIVFTDVVGYSARMGADEEGTLRLFKQDSIQIQGICEKHEGEIRKFTGDGMLMYFHSAVQAVACALEVQRLQAEKAKTMPAEQVLQHRIGIHLGDVFVTEGDVMGDGVNIAARLQAEAEPGGICVSQTVYDVVKNKIALRATYLGPRDLKNISEAVGVYKILLAAQEGDSVVLESAPGGNRPAWLWPAVGAGAVAAVAVLAFALWPRGKAPAPAVVADAPLSSAQESSLSPATAGTTPPAGAALTDTPAPSTESMPADRPADTGTPTPAEPAPAAAVAPDPAPAAATPAPAPAAATPAPAPATPPAQSEREELLARLRRGQITGPQPGTPSTPTPAPATNPIRSVDPVTGEPLLMPDGRPVDLVELRDVPIEAPRGFLSGRTRPEDPSVAVSLRQRGFTVYGNTREYQQRLAATEGQGLAATWFKSTLAEFDRERPLRVNLRLDDGWFPVELWADRNANISVRSIYGIETFVYEEIAPNYLGQLLITVAERRAAEGVRLSGRMLNGLRDFGRTFDLPDVVARAQALR